MRAAPTLLILMILGPALGQVAGMVYCGLFLESFNTFFAAPYMHAGAIGVLAVALFLFVLLGWRSLRLPPAAGLFRRFYLAQLAVASLSLAIGLLQYWPMVGAIADFAYMFASVSVYFIGRLALQSARLDGPDEDGRMARAWTRGSMLCAVAALVAFPLSETIYAVGPSAVLTIIVSLVYLLAFKHEFWTMIVLASPLVMSLAQMNRTTIMVISLTFLIVMAAGGAARVAARALLAMVVLAVVLAFSHESVMDEMNLIETPLGRRVMEIFAFSFDYRNSDEVPLSHRLYETELALTELGKMSPALWVVGAGAGATLDMTQSRDTSLLENAYLGGDRIHNIHFLPAAILYRHGLVGLAAYGYLGVVSLVALYRAVRRARREKVAGMELIAVTYVVASQAGGMFASLAFPHRLAAVVPRRLPRPRDAAEDARRARAGEALRDAEPVGLRALTGSGTIADSGGGRARVATGVELRQDGGPDAVGGQLGEAFEPPARLDVARRAPDAGLDGGGAGAVGAVEPGAGAGVDPDDPRPDRRRQVERAGVVRQEYVRLGRQRRQLRQGGPAADVEH